MRFTRNPDRPTPNPAVIRAYRDEIMVQPLGSGRGISTANPLQPSKSRFETTPFHLGVAVPIVPVHERGGCSISYEASAKPNLTRKIAGVSFGAASAGRDFAPGSAVPFGKGTGCGRRGLSLAGSFNRAPDDSVKLSLWRTRRLKTLTGTTRLKSAVTAIW